MLWYRQSKERGSPNRLSWAGTYTLTYGPGTSFTFLDNVVLDLKSTTSVPEAGSAAGLLCLGFAGMAVLARRRALMA